MSKIFISTIMKNPDFVSNARSSGLEALTSYGELMDEPPRLTAAEADGVVASIAGSSPYTDEFYAAAEDLRVISRWGVGYDQVNHECATRHGVIVTVAPAHMVTVAEYAITQWLATLKRTYTLNRISHGGDFSIIRTFDALGSTIGLFGCGRIGQEVARRARDLLGPDGRLLIYDIRNDIDDIAARYDAEVVNEPRALFEQCDTICLHVSGDETVVHYDLLSAMQPHASLINPSRGNLVNDVDVNRAIEEEKLFYYVVDDPVNGPRALHKDHPRIICTNHNGGISVESVIRLDEMTFGQVTDTLNHRVPQHVLNTDVLEHPRVKEWMAG